MYLFAVEILEGDPRPLDAADIGLFDPMHAIQYMPCTPATYLYWTQLWDCVRRLDAERVPAIDVAPGPRAPTDIERDARRYRRLRVLGAAPGGSKQLDQGTVLRFTNLDAFVDHDLTHYRSRGEAE